MQTAQAPSTRFIVDQKDIDAIFRQTENELVNITGTIAFLADGGRTKLPPQKAFTWACDNALMQVQSGAIDYNKAISGSVKQLANSGLKTVNYESGRVEQVDVAVRRAVMTGVSQLCAKYTEQTAEYLGTDYYEISAHSGARDTGIGWQNHKNWQGKIYSVRSGDIYPNIYDMCGLGEVDGLEGANCRHIRNAWIEGVSERTYTDEQLANIDKDPFEYEGKTYTTYQATQVQRRMENTIRKLKREKIAFESVGDKTMATAAQAKINRMNTKYNEFSKVSGLRKQPERMKVYKPEIGKAASNDSDVSGSGGNTVLAGKVDFSNKNEVEKKLSEVENLSRNLDYEVDCTITSDGNVWITRGDGDFVQPNITSELTGSYSYHNHLKKKNKLFI